MVARQPKPVTSPAEWAQLRAANGTPEYVARRNAIVVANMGLMAAVLRTLYGFDDIDEARSTLYLVLIRCVERFDLSRGLQFSTYFCNSAYHAAVQNRQYHTCARRDVRRKVSAIEGQKWIRSRPVPTDRLPAGDAELVREVLAGLGAREQDIVIRRFWNGETLGDAAKAHGLSKERVRQLEQKALRIMRQDLTEKGWTDDAQPADWGHERQVGGDAQAEPRRLAPRARQLHHARRLDRANRQRA